MLVVDEKGNFTDKVSIIVPVYNSENYLKECLDSVLCQTYTNLEIILVDDGSTDNSASICDNYAGSDERIKVFHKNNGGLSDARNFGVEKSTCDYITWVDCDDVLLPQYVELLYRALKENNADLSVCRHQRFVKRPEIKDWPYSVELLSNKEALQQFGGVNSEFSIMVWGKMYKRCNAVKYRYRDNMTDDLGTTYKHFSSANKICFINKVLYLYRDLPNSLSKQERGTFKKLNTLEEVSLYLEQRSIKNEYVMEAHVDTVLGIRKMILNSGINFNLKDLRAKYLKTLKKYSKNLKIKKKIKYQCILFLWYFNYYKFYSRETGFKFIPKNK